MKRIAPLRRIMGKIDKWSVMGLTGAFWSGMIDMSDLEDLEAFQY